MGIGAKTLLGYAEQYFFGDAANFPDSTAILAGVFADRGYKFAGRAATQIAAESRPGRIPRKPESMAARSSSPRRSLSRCGYKQEAVELLDKWLEFQRRPR